MAAQGNTLGCHFPITAGTARTVLDMGSTLIAKSFGGCHSGSYRNWVLPVGAKAAVLEQLEGIGAVREN